MLDRADTNRKPESCWLVIKLWHIDSPARSNHFLRFIDRLNFLQLKANLYIIIVRTLTLELLMLSVQGGMSALTQGAGKKF
ncbi:hypothetical protein RRG08_024435 [Elysia crispata]|uniref:Uncharacterized protein n=1 Tax=Elysia crispata TaxID=231223 RepID=A0AAE0YP33_9GAST|nr:hypothetical protein RRG08_024435 [Elysia crispata]